MPPANLPNLYTSPQDVYDYVGEEGVQLRVDDRNFATGQTIQATADAPAGATVLNVAVLQYPLLAGSVLEFTGSNQAATVEARTAAVGRVGDASLAVNPLPAQVNALASALDNGVNLAQAARLLKGCRYATSQVKLYCCGRYDDSQLALSWSANRWATALAARWVCTRRAQACPKSIRDDAEEALEEMRLVRVCGLNIEDIGTRTSGWPFVTNVTVDPYYHTAKVRVEQLISEGTPTQYPQFVDYNSIFVLDW